MSNKPLISLERVAGIEPAYSAWKAVKTFNEFKVPFHSRYHNSGDTPFSNETASAQQMAPSIIYQMHSFSAAGRPS